MPSKVLARQMAALICCKILHQSGELDDNLQPIGKEGFRASEPDWDNFELEKEDADIVNESIDPRPGTTRRRQYYYKRVNVKDNYYQTMYILYIISYFNLMILFLRLHLFSQTVGQLLVLHANYILLKWF